MSVPVPDVKVASDVKAAKEVKQNDKKEKDLGAMHDKHAAAAVDIHHQQVAYQERYQQYINESKERVEKLKQETLATNFLQKPVQTFEESLKNLPALRKFLENDFRNLNNTLEQAIKDDCLNNLFNNMIEQDIKVTYWTNLRKSGLCRTSQDNTSIVIKDFKIGFKHSGTDTFIQDNEQKKLITLLFMAIRDLRYEAVQDLISLDMKLGITLNISGTVEYSDSRNPNRMLQVMPFEHSFTPLYYVFENRNEVLSNLDCCQMSFIITDLITKDRSLLAIETHNAAKAAHLSFLHRLVQLTLENSDFIPLLNFVVQNNADVNVLNNLGETALTSMFNFVREAILSSHDLTLALGQYNDILGQIVRILIRTGKQRYTHTTPKCYEIINEILSPYLFPEAQGRETSVFEDTCQLIYEDMALECLTNFFKSSHWQYRDMASVLQYENGIQGDPKTFNKTILRKAKIIAEDSCDLVLSSYILTAHGWDKELIKIILEYAGRNPLTEASHTYFQHAGIPIYMDTKSNLDVPEEATSKTTSAGTSAISSAATASSTTDRPEVIRYTTFYLMRATEIIPRDWATVTTQLEAFATKQSPCILLPKNADEMRKLDTELLKQYPNERLLKEQSTTSATHSPHSICYQYRGVIEEENDDGEMIRKIQNSFITVAPSKSEPNTHSVITHELEVDDAQCRKRPDPLAHLVVIEDAQENPQAQGSNAKPHIYINDRRNNNNQKYPVERINKSEKISLFRNYKGK